MPARKISLLMTVTFLALPLSAKSPDSSAIPVELQYLKADMATSITEGWRQTMNDKSITGRSLKIAGEKYNSGLGTHAPSEMVFKLDPAIKQFTANVGVDDAADAPGSVIFKVILDGNEVFRSGLLTLGQQAERIAVATSGASELRLVVTDGGNGVQGDHANWANAAVSEVAPADTGSEPAGNQTKPKATSSPSHSQSMQNTKKTIPGSPEAQWEPRDEASKTPTIKTIQPTFSTAGFFAVPDSARTVQNFGPGWRFLKGNVAGAEAPAFDDSAWEAANLPHGLEVLGENLSGGRNYQGPAWYRKRFDAAPDGGKVFLYFEAIMGKSTVWVNGQKLAEHFGGYLPFVVDATPALRADGKANVVAVLADNSDDPTYPPGKTQDMLDFTYLGGIYREVYLIRTPELHVTFPETSTTPAGGGIFVGVKDINGTAADLEVRTELRNESKSAKKLLVRTVLETSDGTRVLEDEVAAELPAGASHQFTQQLAPKNIRLWHPDDPYLHFIRTEIVENGKITDSLKTRFGIRLFEMRGPEGMFVNKQFFSAKLSGVNRHQDYPFIGNALPKSGQWRDALLLREGGSNVVRAAHYPLAPAFYDACDELGLLVTTANPGWQFFNFKEPLFGPRLYADTRALVRRDRNHPSMLLWETALNETPDQPENALREMNRIANEEYPFPGFYTVADSDEAKKGGFNFHYHGTDPKINSLTREYGDGGEVDGFYTQNAATRAKREWGETPLLMQAIIRAQNLSEIYGTRKSRVGATLWCGIDHQRGYHPDPFWGGILDSARIPRYSYYLFKSQYAPDYKVPGIKTGPMVKIAHELTQVSGPDVIVYSNCEEVRLTWLGKVIGTQKPDTGYKTLPHPPVTFKNVFDYGIIKKDYRDWKIFPEMIAEGLIGGEVVTREVRHYPQRTTGIAVTIDDLGLGLSADGADFVPVRATVVDNKGVLKVLASESVYFEVEGPAEIIDSPAARNNPAKTEFGVATVLLRATTQPGVIRVRAHAPGLKSGEAVLTSVAPAQPLAYDAAYAAASKDPAQSTALLIKNNDQGSTDMKKLKDDLQRFKQELTGKQQELMELRSKSGNK
jgi:beta-galactosidase